MPKKKRKQNERKFGSIPEIKKKVPEPAKRLQPRFRFIIGFGIILICAILIFFFIKQPRHQSSTASIQSVLQSLSQIDFTGMEPQVVEKIQKLENQVRENPQSSSAWGKLAMNLDVHDLKTESIPCYKLAADLDPKEFRWPYYCAKVLYDIGSQEAFSFFERSIALKPDYAPAHVYYGQALFQNKRLDEASREFSSALNLDAGSVDAFFGLARIALAQNKLEAARANLQKGIESNPMNAEVHGLLSEVYRRSNMPEDAFQELVKSQELPKKKLLTDKFELEMIAEGVSSYWYEQRGRAYLEQGSNEAAISELKQAVQFGHDFRLHDTLAVAYLYSKKYAEAAEETRAALSLNPKSVYSMNNLATALFEMGKADEAIRMLEKAIQTQPDFATSYEHLGKLLLRSGNDKDAINAFHRGIQKVPKDPALALQLAWILATASDSSLRNGSRAVQLADMVCKDENYSNAENLEVLAAAYAESREFANATKCAQRALQIATASGQSELAERIKAQLKYYEAGTPIRE